MNLAHRGLRFGFLAAVLSVVALLGLSTTAEAQTCPEGTRPYILVNQAPSGRVDVNATQNDAHPNNRLTRIDFNTDPHYVGSQTNVSLDLPNEQPGLQLQQQRSVQFTPPKQGYTWTAHSLTPGVAVTYPITIYDDCGPYNTFVGAGPGVFTTALPTYTPTRTPIPTVTPSRSPTMVRTPTLQIFPTSTPQPSTTVGFFPEKVLQGNIVTINWVGRPSPAVNDYIAITTTSGSQVGPAIYTSSCLTTPGTVAKSIGTCPIQIASTLTPGQYVVKLFANGGSGVLAQKTGLEIKQTGGALIGRGQLWPNMYASDDPDIAIAGGFIGVQALISTGDPAYHIPYSYNAVGTSSFGLVGNAFVESGSYKLCFPSGTCEAYPYMSWYDNFGDVQSITWDGSGVTPYYPLAMNNSARFYTFKVFEVSATRWTGEFCIPGIACCPIWKLGDCSDVTPSQAQNSAPPTLQIRYYWAWWGQETLSERWAAGIMHVNNPLICCRVAQSAWTVVDCWFHIWDSFDHNVIVPRVSNCAAPGIGWDLSTDYQ